MQPIGLKDRFAREEELLFSDMNGEVVMLSIGNGQYYNLGAVGGRIWELLAQPITAADIVETLLAEYAVDRERCVAQVLSFLSSLLSENIIRRDYAAAH